MYKRLMYLVCFALVLVLVSNAAAVVTEWTNATGNRAWQDPGNWTAGVPGTGIGIDNTLINGVNHGDIAGPIIGPAIAASTANGDTWGPEWGLGVDILGGSYSGPAFVGMVAVGDDINPAYINLGAMVGDSYTGGSIEIVNFLIGDSWWWHGGPKVTYNQWSGTCIASDYIWLGGKMNLYGGYTKATNGFAMASVGQPSSITTLDIAGGALSLPAAYETDGTVQSWIDNGYLIANGGAAGWFIKRDLITEPGRVVLTAIPEPATMILLGLGSLLLRRKHS